MKVGTPSGLVLNVGTSRSASVRARRSLLRNGLSRSVLASRAQVEPVHVPNQTFQMLANDESGHQLDEKTCDMIERPDRSGVRTPRAPLRSRTSSERTASRCASSKRSGWPSGHVDESSRMMSASTSSVAPISVSTCCRFVTVTLSNELECVESFLDLVEDKAGFVGFVGHTATVNACYRCIAGFPRGNQTPDLDVRPFGWLLHTE